MEDKSHKELCRDNVINIQRISVLRKQNQKLSESLTNYFFGISWRKKGVLSIIDISKKLGKLGK